MTNYAVIEKLRTEGLFLDADTRLRIDYAQTRLSDVLPDLEIAVFPLQQHRFIDCAVDTFGINEELSKALIGDDRDTDDFFLIDSALVDLGYETRQVDLRAYNQWADVVVYGHDPISDEMAKYIEEIFNGDTYYIFKEGRTIYTAPDGRTIEEWETLEIAGDYSESQVWEAVLDCDDVFGALNFLALQGKKSMIAPLTFVTISEEKESRTADVTVHKMKEENGELVEKCQVTTHGANSFKIAEILFLNGRRDYLNAY